MGQDSTSYLGKVMEWAKIALCTKRNYWNGSQWHYELRESNEVGQGSTIYK